ncbi:hypothetical protein BH24ACI1_BH24ACI1_26950 [soil metagenome]
MSRKETEIENLPVSKGAKKPQCHIHDEVKNRQVEEIRQNVCVNDLLPTEFEGKHYCVFHLPTKNKDIVKFEQIFRDRLEAVEQEAAENEKLSEDKQAEAKSKLRYDFRYVWFPSTVHFYNYKFVADVYFNLATFSAVANFSKATFSGAAYFSKATFSTYAYFRKASFSAAADFSLANFEELSRIFFRQTKFSGTLRFNYTNFKGYVAFEGKQKNRLFVGEKALIDLQNARIEDAKKISFHTVRLELGWFINTDATEFVFTDCKWRYAGGKRLNVKTELQNLKNREFENPNALLTKTCWQLADNHEESKSFAKSSLFRQFANQSRRLEERARYLQPFSLHWWYYAVSFYGESWWRAFVVLIGILVLFGLLYAAPFAKFDYGEKKREIAVEAVEQKISDSAAEGERFRDMTWDEGIVHSLYVAALQRPEPKSADTLTKLFVILETIFAPLQAALLALAIRRKFMR